MSQVYPDHPGDLFAVLYDALSDDLFTDSESEAWISDRWVLDTRELAFNEILRTGALPLRITERAIDQRGDQGRFALLWAIDRALDYASPHNSLREAENLHWLVAWNARHHRVDSGAVPGAVVFGTCFPGRPLGRPARATFFSLVRIPATSWDHIKIESIPPSSDVILEPDKTSETKVVVGSAPLVDRSNLDAFPAPTDFGPGYRLELCDDDLDHTISEAIRNLDACGAEVAVMPEGCLSENVLDVWKRTLRDIVPGDASKLSWLIIGTGAVGAVEPPHNRAVLLDRNGRQIAWQDKIADFTLDAQQITDWDLSRISLPRGPKIEDITRGKDLLVLESRIGRICILICEDLTRTSSSRLIGDCAISHVFVPVFSGGLRWAIGAAETYAFQMGTWTVIANSLSVRLGDPSHNLTFATVGPRSDERAKWDLDRCHHDITNRGEVASCPVPVARSMRWDSFTP